MDARKIALEIGLFETALNLEKSGLKGVDVFMPLPSSGINEKIYNSAKWLLNFGKIKYMFLTPEIALIEAMAEQNRNIEAVVVIPCGMDQEAEERLENNLPSKIPVSIIKEPYFPENFIPKDSLIVTCGYSAGKYSMVMNETYRLIEHYGGFHGKKVFVPYVSLEHFEACDGWRQTASLFDENWGNV